MDLSELVEQIRTGALAPVDAPAESDFYAAWQQREVSSPDPFRTAATGGALADRLAWVFIAGYQATLIRCFPTVSATSGWCALVNTEERTGSLPGTSLITEGDSKRLYGWKTWVAAVDHVDLLMVSARHNEPPILAIPRSQEGVHLTSGAPKAYLAEMSQGQARFDGVQITDGQIVGDDETFRAFRASEGAYVRVALNAFILSHASRLGADATLIGGAIAGLFEAQGVLEQPLPSPLVSLALIGVDSQTTWLASEFEAFIRERDPGLWARWNGDSRLVHGASSSMASRAEAALAVWRTGALSGTSRAHS